MESKNRNNTSNNLDHAIIKLYYDKIRLPLIIITKENYYLIFSDESMLEIIHNELKEEDIFKIILLIEEAKEVMHETSMSTEGFRKLLN